MRGSRVKYDVVVVGDEELPAGVKRLIVERVGGGELLLLAESAAGTWAFLQEWEERQQQHGEGCLLRAVS